MNNEFNDDYSFTVLDDDGKEVVCDVISMLKDKKTNEIYVLYTDYSYDESHKFNLYLSEMKEKNGTYTLNTISSKSRYVEILDEAEVVYGKGIEELKSEL